MSTFARSPFFRGLTTAVLAFTAGFALVACTDAPDFVPFGSDEWRAMRVADSLNRITECAATRCTRLDLDSGMLDDYSVLADLTHVTALMMSFTDIDDLSVLAPMTQLTELHIANTPVTDLAPLSNFPMLQVLHTQGLGAVVDLRPIGRVTTLRELAVGTAGMPDIAFIANLRRLERLNLAYSSAPLAPLRGHPGLRTLDLTGVSGISVDLLLSIPNLNEVTLDEVYDDPAREAARDRLRARGIAVSVNPTVVAC